MAELRQCPEASSKFQSPTPIPSPDNDRNHLYSPRADGLIAYWPMDRYRRKSEEGQIIDVGSYEHTGFVRGAQFERGIYGGGVEFDGRHGSISVPSLSEFDPGKLTVSAWINLRAIRPRKEFLVAKSGGRNQGFILQINSTDKATGQVGWKIGNGYEYQKITSSPIEEKEWFHVVGVYSDEQSFFALYINGNKASERSVKTMVSDSLKLTMGAHPTDSQNRTFYGELDEVMIFNRALDESRVNTLYETGR